MLFVFFKLELELVFSRKSTANFSSCATCTSNTAKSLSCHELLQLPQTLGSINCSQLSPLLQESGGRSETWLDTWSKRKPYSAACQCSRKLKQGWMSIWRCNFSSWWTSPLHETLMASHVLLMLRYGQNSWQVTQQIPVFCIKEVKISNLTSEMKKQIHLPDQVLQNSQEAPQTLPN